MASRMVVLPAPVGPVIAKIPSAVKSGAVRSTSHSPTSELRFLNRTLVIRMPSPYSARGSALAINASASS